MKIKIELNNRAKKHKYALMADWYCIGNFSNKRNAEKMKRFLIWYQDNFGEFNDETEAAARLCNIASQANIHYLG